jgi:hypothetical protein
MPSWIAILEDDAFAPQRKLDAEVQGRRGSADTPLRVDNYQAHILPPWSRPST